MKTAQERYQQINLAKILSFFVLTFFLSVGYLFLATKSVQAQVFSLSPATASKTVGEEFTVSINIDTQNQAVTSADAKLTYDSTVLEVVKVDNGTFFTDEASYIGSGTVYVGGFFKTAGATKTGTGLFATLTLKGKQAGSSPLTFVCSTAKDDSNIFDVTGNDLIKCSGIVNGSYSLTGTALATNVSTASAVTVTPSLPTGIASATPTPPVSGTFLPTVLFGGLGVLLTIFGIAIIL